MRTWTKSACVVLAWSILPVILMTAGVQGSVHPAHASTRTDRHTEVSLTSTRSVAAVSVTTASPPKRYVVQRGDTLSGIAARFAVHGGWPALYAANRPLIGPNPNLLHAGTVLVLPDVVAPVRYPVAAGDTLSGIAAGLAVRGGWPALYRANRHAIGPDPNAIHTGTVLTVPRSAAPSPSTPGAGRQPPHPVPAPSPLASTRHDRRPVTKAAPTATGMPQWLKLVLLAIGLFALLVFLAESVLAIRRRRQQAALAWAVQRRRAERGHGPGPGEPCAEKARIVLADYERVVVTRNKHDGTICVLRPPGEDPLAILRVARLVLPEGQYGELARQLSVPAIWPMK